MSDVDSFVITDFSSSNGFLYFFSIDSLVAESRE
jgi:hypothetical protein